MHGCCLGVDLGSTTAKAVIVDRAGAISRPSVVQMGAVSREAVARAIEGRWPTAG